MTSQKPNPESAAEKNFSSEMYLPLSTPSMSNPPSFTCLILYLSKVRFTCWRFMTVASPARLLVKRHPNGFHLRIGLERMGTHFAAEPALLVAAKGRSTVKTVIGVDPDGAGFNPLRQSMSHGDVPCPDG